MNFSGKFTVKPFCFLEAKTESVRVIKCYIRTSVERDFLQTNESVKESRNRRKADDHRNKRMRKNSEINETD